MKKRNEQGCESRSWLANMGTQHAFGGTDGKVLLHCARQTGG